MLSDTRVLIYCLQPLLLFCNVLLLQYHHFLLLFHNKSLEQRCVASCFNMNDLYSVTDHLMWIGPETSLV